MTIVNGRNWGQGSSILRVQQNFTLNNPGLSTDIPLDQAPCHAEDGLEYGVLAIIVKLSGMSWTVPAGNYVDGVTLSQLVANTSLQLAKGSPPSQWNASDQLWTGIDNYRLLQMLSFFSGQPPLYVDGGERVDFSGAAPTVDAGPTTTASPVSHVRTRGWLQNLGAFTETNTGGAGRMWTEDVYLYYWVGVDRTEKWGSGAIPVRWFTGEKPGCAKTAPAILKLAVATTVDNAPVTWPSPPKVSVFFKCLKYPPTKAPLPLVPRVNFAKFTQSIFKLTPGITKFRGPLKPLTAAGAMQTHNYSQVRVSQDGVELTEQEIAVNVLDVLTNSEDQRYFDITAAEDTLSFRPQTRLSRAGLPLLLWHRSNLLAPGDPNKQVDINVLTSGETTYDFIDFTLMPRDPAVEAAARDWAADGGQSTVGSSTDNGNSQASFQATGKQAVLPGVVQAPLTSIPVLTHG